METINKRNEIVDKLNSLIVKRKEILSMDRLDDNHAGDDLSMDRIDNNHVGDETQLNKSISNLGTEYLDSLPELVISKCPYTGRLIDYTIDIYGFSGPWWNHSAPIRDEVDGGHTFFALSGAMKVNQINESPPFTVFPGPDLPFVLPRILERHEIKAVISSFDMNGNTLWLMSYFSFPFAYDLERVNTYGTNRYEVKTLEGQRLFYESSDSLSDYDFDIKKWIEKGKLLWLKPNDSTHRLHSTILGCPFIDLGGEGRIQIIHNSGLTYLDAIKIGL